MTGPDDGEVADDFGMTDVEERLRGPDGDAARDAILERLAVLAERVEAALRAGLKPGVYADAEAVRNGLAAARTCMLAIRQS